MSLYTYPRILLGILFITVLIPLNAQKTITTKRTIEPIIIDGNLEEWTDAPQISDFTQFEPKPGEPSNYRSICKVLYDDQAMYIAAELYDTMTLVRTDLSPRDEVINADWFGIILDTYKNGLTGVSFRVTAAGVQLDDKWTGDDDDGNWDAVWDSKVVLLDDKWVVEMKIPYAALRFSDEPEQEWYLQFGRYVRRSREFAHWSGLDPTKDGIIRQSGIVNGIENIKSPIRLSLTPFVVGTHTNLEGTTGNTFSAGMDLKYGINEAFTLDMTLIPDFSQVQADDQVVNLGPFEVFFEERRQFFTEGTELFNRAGIFYSRRIGGNLHYGDDLAGASDSLSFATPSKARLINASKVSGRFANGSGLGVFNAIESGTTVDATDDNGNVTQLQAHPLTNYNVLVYDHALPHNSYISLVNTNVLRQGTAHDANVTGTEFQIRNKEQKLEISGEAAISQKFYKENTDRGHKANIQIKDISGKWTSALAYGEESANYDPNDLGFLFSPNERGVEYYIEYQDFKPANFTRYRMWFNTSLNGLYKPSVFTSYNASMGGFWFTKKFFAFGFFSTYQPKSRNYFEPRTSDFSKYYQVPSYVGGGPFISTDYSKRLAIDVSLEHFYNFDNPRRETYLSIQPRWQVNTQCFLFIEARISKFENKEAYINKDEFDYQLFGLTDDDVAFGLRNRQVVNNSIRLNYIFTNKMSANLRVRHYWDKVDYDEYYKLNTDGSLTTLAFNGLDDDGNKVYKGNFNFFNVDLNYIWRFAPGSDMILSYKNNAFSDPQLEQYAGNLKSLFEMRSNHFVSLKVLYFLDWNTLVQPS